MKKTNASFNTQNQENSNIKQKIDDDKNKDKQQLWKKNNIKAQKNGPHRTIYWVKQQKKYEDGTFKGEKWTTSVKYIGDWKDNKRHGFGIQYYENGDKYEGGWENNFRNGQGTLWVMDDNGKLRREYTGDWNNDKKSGRGTMFFKTGERYDGFWFENKLHGEGRMIYSNGDVYEGQWCMGKRSGYGVLTKRNGDHFEGHWIDDKREGQGSYFYNEQNKVFIGEWVEDMPKCGVYSECEDPEAQKRVLKQNFEDGYQQPEIPPVKLDNPAKVLNDALEETRKNRLFKRASLIPLFELYNEEELQDLVSEFKAASGESDTISFVNLIAILLQMNCEKSEEELEYYLHNLDPNINKDEIDFEIFCRLLAILLDEVNDPKKIQRSIHEESFGQSYDYDN